MPHARCSFHGRAKQSPEIPAFASHVVSPSIHAGCCCEQNIVCEIVCRVLHFVGPASVKEALLFSLQLEYSTELWFAESAERMLNRFVHTLEQFVGGALERNMHSVTCALPREKDWALSFSADKVRGEGSGSRNTAIDRDECSRVGHWGALFLHALSRPSTICPFPPHGWSALDGLPLL